jgi:hypothetical protein
MIIAKEIEEVHGSGEADDHSLRDKSPAPLVRCALNVVQQAPDCQGTGIIIA